MASCGLGLLAAVRTRELARGGVVRVGVVHLRDDMTTHPLALGLDRLRGVVVQSRGDNEHQKRDDEGESLEHRPVRRCDGRGREGWRGGGRGPPLSLCLLALLALGAAPFLPLGGAGTRRRWRARMGGMERTRDEMLQAAEAEVGRIHEVLLKLEAERDAATERIDQIADEPFDTPEEEAELRRRVEIADQELGRIQERIAEAEDDFRRAQADFDDYLSGADDDDGDSGETLSVSDAADIWLSKGRDEDYMFGYTEDELRRAAEEQ